MAEEFDDEFIVEGEEEERSNRPFYIAAGSLLGILALSLICLFAVQTLNLGGGEEVAQVDESQMATVTAIYIANATTEAFNLSVTETIVAMETIDAMPTATPTSLPPTNTPLPTSTPLPTETPVVAGAIGDGDDEEPNAEATSLFEGVDTVDEEDVGDTSGAAASSGSSSSSSSGGSGTSGSSGGGQELPETGVSVYGALAAAFALLMVLVVARRLRMD